MTVSISGSNYYTNPSNSNSSTNYYRVDYDYLELPILAKYNLTKDSYSPYFIAGGNISYLISAISVKTKPSFEKTDIIDGSETFDYGILLGGGIDFSIYKYMVFVEGRYSFGLNNITKSSSDLKNSVVSVNLGLHL